MIHSIWTNILIYILYYAYGLCGLIELHERRYIEQENWESRHINEYIEIIRREYLRSTELLEAAKFAY